jgi:hypothetical protein
VAPECRVCELESEYSKDLEALSRVLDNVEKGELKLGELVDDEVAFRSEKLFTMGEGADCAVMEVDREFEVETSGEMVLSVIISQTLTDHSVQRIPPPGHISDVE